MKELLSYLFGSLVILSLCLYVVPDFQLESYSDFGLSVFIIAIMNFVFAPFVRGLGYGPGMLGFWMLSFLMNVLLLNVATGLIDEYEGEKIGAAMIAAALLSSLQILIDYQHPDRRRIITTP